MDYILGNVVRNIEDNMFLKCSIKYTVVRMDWGGRWVN